MYHSQVNEYKYEIDRVNKEMQDLKGKYFQLRKKRQNQKKSNQSFINESELYPAFDSQIASFNINADNSSKNER
jgi:hypothetical protein